MAYWAFAAVIASLRRTPLPLAHVLARFYVRAFDLSMPRLRKIASRNLSIALPQADSTLMTDGVFRSVARMLVAFSRFPDLQPINIGQWIRYEGLEYFTEAKRRGRGVLFATAHLGAWELSAFAHALMSEPMNVVVRPLDNPLIDAAVAKYRAASGNTLISKKDAARAILRALQRNEAVGVLIDQNVLPEEGTFVDFFGVKACAGTAFVRIAQKTGAAVIPGYALWSDTEGRYILKFYPLVEFSGDVHADTQLLNTHLEHVVREYPDQWLWIHRRWKTRPPGEASFY